MDIHIIRRLKKRRKEAELLAYTETGKPDYDYYIMSKNERILYSIIGIAVFFLLGFTFYKSVMISAVISVFGLFMPEYMYQVLVNRRKEKLNLQFKDLLYCISSGLAAGRSIETTLKEAEKELYLLYPSEEYDIIKEIQYINHGMGLNVPVEELLKDFAERSHDEDIMSFSDVFISCKRTGGNLIEVARTSSNIISDKIEIKRNIQVTISDVRFEQKVMNILMLLVLLAMTYASGDYMDMMFQGIMGRIVMTIALLIYIASFIVGQKLLDIEV